MSSEKINQREGDQEEGKEKQSQEGWIYEHVWQEYQYLQGTTILEVIETKELEATRRNDPTGRFVEVEDDYGKDVPCSGQRTEHFINAGRINTSWTTAQFHANLESRDILVIKVVKDVQGRRAVA